MRFQHESTERGGTIPSGTEAVGQIGLGIMGGAFAKHLLAAGFAVMGFDPDRRRAGEFRRRGGRAAASGAAVAARCGTIITSLPSIKACEAVFLARDGIAARARRGTVVIETSTMPLATKIAVHEACAARGITVLDCPISGTGAQAAAKDISVYASGERLAVEMCEEVFAGFARSMHYCGAFGNGTKLKFVANLLVTVHNLAAAEAIVLGLKSGLDLDLLFKVIRDGAGNSRMFEVRGPLMVANDYSEAHMKCEVYQKDIDVIGDYAAQLRCPTPLFEASKAYYSAALAQGHARDDTAAICAVLERMAGIERKPLHPPKRKGRP
jgi:3-hydroxyisobutyrate dehydrogenase-like beta-hydroxyacid dehydrogenase